MRGGEGRGGTAARSRSSAYFRRSADVGVTSDYAAVRESFNDDREIGWNRSKRWRRILTIVMENWFNTRLFNTMK